MQRTTPMKSIYLLCGLLSIFLLSCWDAGINPPLVDYYHEDIVEAVFRHQFVHKASGMQQHASFYFISYYLNGDSVTSSRYIDVSSALVRRFAGTTPQVKNFSDCEFREYYDGVFDKHTGLQGLLFWIRSVKQTGEYEVEVYGGYYEAGLSSSGNIYVLKKDGNSTWTVVKDTMIWIS